MRNVFLGLLLANLLAAAWQLWVSPSPRPLAAAATAGMTLRSTTTRREAAPDPVGIARSGVGESGAGAPGKDCFQIGPFPEEAAMQQAQRILAGRGISTRRITREAQLWLGHWVRIDGLASPVVAEEARRRLLAGGLAEAYLMQEATDHAISLGIFRDLEGAQRVVAAARALGFSPGMRNRYRSTAEQWLLTMTGRADPASLEVLRLSGGRILRVEPTACGGAGGPSAAPQTRDVD